MAEKTFCSKHSLIYSQYIIFTSPKLLLCLKMWGFDGRDAEDLSVL